ncbi:hypothetical protein [Nannocystis bainbridge]|uniref:Bacteriocin-type signal sequence-containing protein n=1 Tax=Nannocystis bainbridge TaxID=2995303 RepID=A0ABT5DRN1_9BACT|nr:hypothetical protein [Nannocystis bainbridge]MDC0715820.1 hypothetical protein [Nannocystis bainbridge]
MKKNLRKNEEKQLPKFTANTLGADELCQVTGGMPPESSGTKSKCHIDGVNDND